MDIKGGQNLWLNVKAKLVLLFLIVCFGLNGQGFKLKVYQKAIPFNSKYREQHEDSLSVLKELSNIEEKLWREGFLSARIESQLWKKDSCIAYVEVGQFYSFVNVKIPEELSSFHDDRVKTNYSYQSLSSLMEKVVSTYENKGYPFAKAWLDSLSLKDETFYGNLKFDKGYLITWDSLIIDGDSLNTRFLQRYLGIKRGAPFNQQLARDADNKLKALPWLQINSHVTVRITRDKAYLIIKANQTKASTLQGIMGFVPGNGASGYRLNGEFTMRLENIFEESISAEIDGQKISSGSSRINLKGLYPKVGGEDLDFAFGFSSLKQDSFYFHNKFRLEPSFQMNNLSSISVIYEQDNTRLTSLNSGIDTVNYSQQKISWYGLGFNLKKTDFLPLPRNGFLVHFEALAGNKKFETGGANQNKTKLTYRYTGKAMLFLPLSKRIIFIPEVSTANIKAEKLYKNDLFRLGGLNSLLGYDEESIYCEKYLRGNLGLRLLTDRQSFLSANFNTASYKYEQKNHINSGAAIGYSYSTKAGWFSVNFAVPISVISQTGINNTRIHIGYLNSF